MIYKLFLILFCLFMSSSCLASFQISDAKQRAIGKEISETHYPMRYSPKIIAIIKKGSLFYNVQRITVENGWILNWRVKKNYQVAYHNNIAGPTFMYVMNRLLSHYPLTVNYNFKSHQKSARVITVTDTSKKKYQSDVLLNIK